MGFICAPIEAWFSVVTIGDIGERCPGIGRSSCVCDLRRPRGFPLRRFDLVGKKKKGGAAAHFGRPVVFGCCLLLTF